MKTILSVVFAVVFSVVSTAGTWLSSADPARFVDPFIGTQGDGNTFPGATCPFGLVKLGPDCGDLNSNMGYRASGPVRGFSHLHVSGTGGGCKYGNILVCPFTGEVEIADYGAERSSEHAEPGYFSTELAGGAIVAELTATPRAGFHRYTFRDPGPCGILVDAGSILGPSVGFGEAQVVLGSEIEVLSSREIAGYNRVSGGWNMGGAFTVYFYALFDTPAAGFGTWKSGVKHEGCRSEYDSGEAVGAWFSYDGLTGRREVEVRVGISFVSVGKARENCMREVAGLSFDRVRTDARGAWNGYLSRVDVRSDDRSELTKFYTALYHTLLQPVDKTGENALWRSDAPYYDDFYCIWDTFRTSHPLLTLVAPEREAEIVASLVDIYKHEGYMPDGRSGDCNGRTQGGSNAEMVVADAILKDLAGFDCDDAFEAMRKDAEAAPGGDGRKHGRGGLDDYKRLGYVSTDFERAGTRTLEYAANDWAIAQCAEKLERHDLAETYARRAGAWENLWRPVEFDGVTGFIMPRRADGAWDESFADPTWEYYSATPGYRLGIEPYRDIPAADRKPGPFTPLSAGSWCNFFYESHSWEYSFYVPHDVARLIEKCGGREAFVERLDTFFDKGYFNITNEPGFLVPCLYIYAGRHDRTVERIGELLEKHYTDRPDGLPGNDDSGAMSSWYVFHRLGFFPNAGQDIYLITAPGFEQAEVSLGEGVRLRIAAENFSPENRYVAKVFLNGEPWDRAWFRHADIAGGGELRFVMSDRPTEWGAAVLPPSRSDGRP